MVQKYTIMQNEKTAPVVINIHIEKLVDKIEVIINSSVADSEDVDFQNPNSPSRSRISLED